MQEKLLRQQAHGQLIKVSPEPIQLVFRFWRAAIALHTEDMWVTKWEPKRGSGLFLYLFPWLVSPPAFISLIQVMERHILRMIWNSGTLSAASWMKTRFLRYPAAVQSRVVRWSHQVRNSLLVQKLVVSQKPKTIANMASWSTSATAKFTRR